jgi:hypothetical protein
MGKKVAGTAFVKADGAQFTVTGGLEAPLMDKKRETIAPGYFKEEDLPPYLVVSVVHDPDLPIAQLTVATDTTVTGEFANGGVYVLSGAYLVGEPAAKGDDGTLELRWEGTKGVWQ